MLLELGIDAKEAVELLQLVSRGSNKDHAGVDPSATTTTVTALDLLQTVNSQQPVVTFSEQLDTLLAGGVALGKITEFCGAPGAGKTQIW